MNRFKSPIIGKVINILLNIAIVFFGIILMISIYNFVQTKFFGNSYSNFFGYSLFEIQTGSMEPSISAGDWIIVKRDKEYDLKDVVTFELNGTFVTHRIIEKYDNSFITQGDANNVEDEAIKEDQIVGTVSKVLPSFGVIKSTVLNPLVIILLIVVFYITSLILKGESVSMLAFFKKLFDKKEKVDDFDNFGEDVISDDELPKIDNEVVVNDYSEVEEDYTTQLIDVDAIKNSTEESEDLSKTTFFRIISVSEDEVDQVRESSLEEEEEVVEEEVVPEVAPEIEVVEEEKTFEETVEDKIAMDEIFTKPEHKACKGVIAKLMAIKSEEIYSILTELDCGDKPRVNEVTIRKELVKSYIESKYYNIFSKSVAVLDRRTSTAKFKYVIDNDSSIINEKNGFTKLTRERAKKQITRIGNALEEDSSILCKNYSGSDKDYVDKLRYQALELMLISKLEFLAFTSKDMNGKKALYTKEIERYISISGVSIDNVVGFSRKLIDIQKKYARITKCFLDRLKTETFDLVYSPIKGQKTKFIVNVKHNLNFSQVYSDDVIEKVYQGGLVAEDKVSVLLTLLQTRLGKDMINGEFMNEYLVGIPSSLCNKEKKFGSVFKNNDDEYAKKNIIYLIGYDAFMKHGKTIKELRKNGYRISCYIDTETKFKSKNKLLIANAEYIFIDKKVKNLAIASVINENFKDRVIKEDLAKKLDLVGDDE